MTRAVSPLVGVETVPVSRASGRVLAHDQAAPVDLPPFDNSAMDGYALCLDGVDPSARLPVVGSSLAGHPYLGTLSVGECVRITTGAMIPNGADTVVIQENCERRGDHIRLLKVPERGSNIRSRGSDVRKDQLIARSGQLLNAFDIAWLAACGVPQVQVRPRVRVAVFSTGDELIPPGEAISPGEIYDSNRVALIALLKRLPVAVTDLGILPDREPEIESALDHAARNHDLLLTTGGVSVGDADYVKDVIENLGALELWKLNLKPGKPLAFGTIHQTPFIGLPGNPVSSLVTFLLVARPLIDHLAGAVPEPPLSLTARLLERITHTPGREEYQRGRIDQEDGGLRVRVLGDQSSHRLATFSGANCLIRIPKSAGDMEPGTDVEILPFPMLLS